VGLALLFRALLAYLLCFNVILTPQVHVAIIMGGNGRWARKCRLPRIAGHAEGDKAARTPSNTAAHAGVEALTRMRFFFANWARPQGEADTIMCLLSRYLFADTGRWVAQFVNAEVKVFHPCSLFRVPSAGRRSPKWRRHAVSYPVADAITLPVSFQSFSREFSLIV